MVFSGPTFLSFQQPKEKESTSRRIASFFNNLTPNSSSSKNTKKAGFTGIVTTNGTESSSSSDVSNRELPPIDSKGRLTVTNSNSRSTTPSYAESRASSRRKDRDNINLSRLSKAGSQDKENKPQNNASKEIVLETAGAGTSTSRNQSDRVIYPVRTKTSDQLR